MSYWKALQAARLSRRRLLAASAVGAGGIAAAAGLGRFGPPRARAAGEWRYGGTQRFAISGDWGTIDPVKSVAFGPAIFPRVYNTLVARTKGESELFFDLAESFEQPDEVTYIFQIRPGVRIAPNRLGIPERALNSLDVVRWMERLRDDPAAVRHGLAGGWISSFEAYGSQTFALKTPEPYAYLFSQLGSPLGGCIPPREFAERGLSLVDQGAGAGPFGVIVPGSYANTGGIIIQRNPNYYRRDKGNRLPYADRLQAIRIADRTPRRQAFIDRQIDRYSAFDADDAAFVAARVPDASVLEQPVNTFISFVMNPQRAPWNDERIRRAALHALNRQQFVDDIVGTEFGRANGLVHWPLYEYALPQEELDALQAYDPQMSQQLIRDATGNDRITISVIFPVSDIEFHNQHLPIWRQQMQAAGFDLEEEPQDFTTWLSNYQFVNYDASLSLNQIYETPELPLDFHHSLGPVGDGTFAIGIGALYPEVDDAIAASKRATIIADHIRLVQDAQRLIYGRGPAFLPIFSWLNSFFVHAYVRNFQKHPFVANWWLDEDAPVAGEAGDTSCDGVTNSLDAALALQADAGLIADVPCEHSADVNNDGRINSLDAALILQFDGGLIPGLPV